jgi:peptidoglycan/xylan/chitin deacetylase (PgdA/CDA1 family)
VTGSGIAEPQTVVVTTSWDDGHVLDTRLAEMLVARALAATFYIAPDNAELAPADRLDDAAVRDLSQMFEIGGHTVSHRRLPDMSTSQAADEIRVGKDRLEQVTARRVDSFAYPGGSFRDEHADLVEQAGFRCARTTIRGSTSLGGDPYRMPTTLQARQHPRDWPRIVAGEWSHPRLALACVANWATLATTIFDRVLSAGGLFHLWGHSWEIDRFGQWRRLEDVLDHVARRPGVVYATNAETLDIDVLSTGLTDEPS